jgi:hypothetical protein
MMQPHSKLLDLAAKQHLAPLGLKRKGRSRVWIGDQRWYAIVVEFQPSGYSKGSFLNVSAHFLWSASGHLSFDLGNRVEDFIEFVSEAQFAPEANRLAEAAAREVGRLRALLTGVQVVASSMPENSVCWPSYHRAIALGLAGDAVEASPIFMRLGNPSNPLPWEAERAKLCLEFQRLLAQPTEFRAVVNRLIQQQRSALRLPEVDQPFTDIDVMARA